jgi:hypothetical protein
MWPFKQKVEAPAAEGPKPVPAPVIRRDWVGLPPIQRIVGAHPLTAPSDRFHDDLVTHQDPSVSSDTMGHQVSAEAPPGLVLALARPTTRSDGPAMIPRPRVQRSVASAVAESGEWDGDEAASESTRPTPIPTSAHTVAARELPVVAPEPAVQRLVSLPPDAAPTPLPTVAQRSGAMSTPFTMSAPGDEPAETPSAPLQRLTLGQSRRMGLGAPINRVPDRSVQRAAPELPLPPPPQTEKVEASPVVTEPIDASPIGPLPDRSVQRTAIDLPLPTIPQRARQSRDASPTESIDTSTGTRELMDASSVEQVPDRSVQRAASELPLVTLPEKGRESMEADAPRLDLPLARSPLPKEREITAAPSVQLSAEPSPEPERESSTVAPSAVQRVAQGGLPTPLESSREQTQSSAIARASTPGVSVSRLPLATESLARVSRFAAPSASDMSAMAPLAGARLLRPTTTLQRDASIDATPTMTLPQSAAENQGTVVQREMEDAPTLTLPQRRRESAQEDSELPSVGVPDDAPSVTPVQRAREDGRMPLAPSRGISVQRESQSVDDTEPEPAGADEADGPTVQGAWYAAPVAVSRVTAVASTVESSAASAGPHQASEIEMDELARRLYDRLRSRLKTELLVDRERAGFLTDLR